MYGSDGYGGHWLRNDDTRALWPSPTHYHIWQLYGRRDWVYEWLKVDYNRRGSDESTDIVQRAIDNGYMDNTKSHLGGMGFDLSVGGNLAPKEATDFLLDVIYNSSNEEELAACGPPSRTGCYFHDNHLHLEVPRTAVNLL